MGQTLEEMQPKNECDGKPGKGRLKTQTKSLVRQIKLTPSHIRRIKHVRKKKGDKSTKEQSFKGDQIAAGMGTASEVARLHLFEQPVASQTELSPPEPSCPLAVHNCHLLSAMPSAPARFHRAHPQPHTTQTYCPKGLQADTCMKTHCA